MQMLMFSLLQGGLERKGKEEVQKGKEDAE